MKLNSALVAWMVAIRHRLANMLGLSAPVAHQPPSLEQRARDLVRAIDAGGIPLNPAIVNSIARQLGLEVSTHAPMAETVERIRKALETL